jgi:hypothetical protein
MTAVAWTLLRSERERTAARVAALEALAFSDTPSPTPPPISRLPDPSQPRMVGFDDGRAEHAAVSAAERPWDLALHEPPGGDRKSPEVDVLRTGSPPIVLADDMFEAPPATGAALRRGLALGAVALLVAAGVAAVSALRTSEPSVSLRPDGTGAHPPAGQPLQLLSLGHAIDAGGVFTVTGLVQNPADGRRLESVEAVVYLFDKDDHYFATGRAPLDVWLIQPGDESPFAVKLPKATGVSRYRVGFRYADGRAVAHIDRRGQLPAGTTGGMLTAEPGLAQPAGGMRPVEGVPLR